MQRASRAEGMQGRQAWLGSSTSTAGLPPDLRAEITLASLSPERPQQQGGLADGRYRTTLPLFSAVSVVAEVGCRFALGGLRLEVVGPPLFAHKVGESPADSG